MFNFVGKLNKTVYCPAQKNYEACARCAEFLF